jgi:hypothetical protein
MKLQYGAYVNIVTLVVYFTYLCLAIYLSVRQGLGHNFPWICMIVLSLCRLTQVYPCLVGSALQKLTGTGCARFGVNRDVRSNNKPQYLSPERCGHPHFDQFDAALHVDIQRIEHDHQPKG